MQHIKTFFQRNYHFLDDTIKIYEHFSDVYNDDSIFRNTISNNFKEIIDFVYDNGFKEKYDYFEYHNNKEKIENQNIQKEKVLLFFSGGKYSVYCALKLKEKYDVTLYFLRGINKSYPNEIERAKECAEILGLPLIVQNVSLNGKSNFLENPFKNMVIYACGLNYGLEKGITLYCFGNAKNDTIKTANFDRDYSDTQEMIALFEKCINKSLKNPIKSLCLIEDYYDSIIYLSKFPKLYDVIQSCISPYRFKNKLKEINEKKYNIKLSQYDCGSCWKCCVKYILYMDFALISYNKNFYIHCLNVLKAKANEELNNFNKEKTYQNIYIEFLNSNFYDKSILKREGF